MINPTAEIGTAHTANKVAPSASIKRHPQQYTTVVKRDAASSGSHTAGRGLHRQVRARPLQQIPHGTHRTQAHSI